MTSTETRSALLGAALVTLVFAGGCGGATNAPTSGGDADDEGAIRNVVGNFQNASRKGDGGDICTQIFTPKLADTITNSSKSGSCAKEVRSNVFSSKTTYDVEAVEVMDQANAKATVKEQNGKTTNFFFVKQGGEWRIRSITPG
jgi:Domain of unknown function (DUF4878)